MNPSPLIRPWVGWCYFASPPGERLFLLGESMYARHLEGSPDDTYSPDSLVSLVQYKADGNRWFPFYDRVYHTVTGRRRTHSTRDQIASFWQRVGLYNFVQAPVRGGPRTRPTDEMWDLSPPYFRAVFEALRPDRAIVFGKDLLSRLYGYELVAADPATPGFGRLGTASHTCRAAFIPHPASMGFSAARWYAERVVPLLAGPVDLPTEPTTKPE